MNTITLKLCPFGHILIIQAFFLVTWWKSSGGLTHAHD